MVDFRSVQSEIRVNTSYLTSSAAGLTVFLAQLAELIV